MSFYRNVLEDWLKTIEVKAEKVLDLGGAAKPIAPRVRSFEAEECVCFDFGIEEAQREYIQFDINQPLEQLQGFQDQDFDFDVIFCLEVFEYVWNPVEAHKNLFRLLSRDGTAYISYPSIYPVHNPVNYDYLRYTQKAIEKYLQNVGLEIQELLPRKATSGLYSLSQFYSEEGMHPVRNSELPFHIGYLVKVRKPY